MPGSPGGSGSFPSFSRWSGEADELISRVRCLNAWKRTHQITKETNYTEMRLSKYFLKTSDLCYRLTSASSSDRSNNHGHSGEGRS